MANGTYGTRKPANITINDVDIFYHYRPSRGSDAAGYAEWRKGDAASWLSNCTVSGSTLQGMYNLRLPMDIFSNKGIYTIYIKPKEIEATISDVSTLTGNFSNIRGIVIDTAGSAFSNGDLVGYRVEYDENGTRSSDYRIITSNNRVEPISVNTGGAMQKSVRYTFNDSSTLTFCTVTPSTAPSFKANSFPSIGKTGQKIFLINTKFNPVAMEIEMVEHDADTLSIMMEGAQLRDLDHGIITTFDNDGNIYHQASYGNITNPTEDVHTDFKLPYSGTYIRSEEDKLAEIRNQVFNG